MNSKFRRRSFRIGVLSLACAVVGVISAGCAKAPRAEAPEAKKTQARAGTGKAALEERAPRSAQADGQRAWCSYLEALYLRSTEGVNAWPRREECLHAATLASPEMLSRTARCSRAALDRVQGDPFTRAYAAEVSRCGAETLDALEASDLELAPFVTAICERVSECGEATYAECQDGLLDGLGPHLGRAVGAMNDKGRAVFRVCLTRISCGDMGTQVVGCLEPIIDNLLWLPQ